MPHTKYPSFCSCRRRGRKYCPEKAQKDQQCDKETGRELQPETFNMIVPNKTTVFSLNFFVKQNMNNESPRLYAYFTKVEMVKTESLSKILLGLHRLREAKWQT